VRDMLIASWILAVHASSRANIRQRRMTTARYRGERAQK